MNQIVKFTAPQGSEIRTIIKDNEPWFIATDVCKALDLENTAQALSRLDEDEKGIISNDTLGGVQNTSIISESGLYGLVLSSRKQEAKAFRKWVTSEVLPAIRKTGSYSMNSTPKTFAEALRLAADQAEKIEQQQKLIENQKPAVTFVENFVEAKQTQPLRMVAKVLGVKEKEFVKELLSRSVLYRLGGKLTPKAELANNGFFEVKEVMASNGFATTQMRFTPSGVELISRKIMEWGLAG